MDAVLRKPSSAADWEAIRAICRDTAAGEVGEGFDEYWIGPYQALLPEWTTAAFVSGALAGYLTACPASMPFYVRRSLTRTWRRPLRQAFPPWVWPKILIRYPAHLHVNVAPAFQGQGLGRALMEHYLDALRAASVPGVHLVCGQAPLGFYRGLGFVELARSEGLHILGRKL